MKLYDAQVCLDCDELVSRGQELCSCSSGALVPLTQWIAPLDAREEIDAVHTLASQQ